MNRRLSARWRLAIWCALLVTISGVVLVTLIVVLSQLYLHNAARPPSRPAGRLRGGPGPGGLGLSQPARPASPRALGQQGLRAQEALDHVRVIGLEVLLGLVVASVGIGWLVAGRMLEPITRLVKATRTISHTDMSERIGMTGPQDELKDLADGFDEMLARLESAFNSQRRFVSDASHELRTPLAVIRSEVDVALDNPDSTSEELRESLGAIREAEHRAQRLTDSLLQLAVSELPPVEQNVRLERIAEQAIGDAMVAAGDTGAQVKFVLDLQPAPVAGNPELLERLVENLVENAIRYNVPGGSVEVSSGCVKATGQDSQGDCFVKVANDGQAIDPAKAEAIFGRFTRLDASRSSRSGGFGLGLSIVDSIVHAHGGKREVEARPEGGLEITVLLPTGKVAGDGNQVS